MVVSDMLHNATFTCCIVATTIPLAFEGFRTKVNIFMDPKIDSYAKRLPSTGADVLAVFVAKVASHFAAL